MPLLEFYGETCPHCVIMTPLIKKLEDKEGIVIERYEVWGNKKNAAKMKKLDKGRCDGVPFFINTETGKTICGQVDYETLKTWAKGVRGGRSVERQNLI